MFHAPPASLLQSPGPLANGRYEHVYRSPQGHVLPLLARSISGQSGQLAIRLVVEAVLSVLAPLNPRHRMGELIAHCCLKHVHVTQLAALSQLIAKFLSGVNLVSVTNNVGEACRQEIETLKLKLHMGVLLAQLQLRVEIVTLKAVLNRVLYNRYHFVVSLALCRLHDKSRHYALMRIECITIDITFALVCFSYY